MEDDAQPLAAQRLGGRSAKLAKPFPKLLPKLLVTFGAAGLVSRLVLSLVSVGSNDAVYWVWFGRFAREHGLAALYGHLFAPRVFFNHPPLMAFLARGSLSLGELTGVPPPFWLRLPGILGEVLVAWLLWRIWRARRGRGPAAAWAVAIFGWAPCSLLVSGFHGNTDTLCAALLLLSAWLLAACRAPALAGLALGAAINVKIIPCLALLPLAAACGSRRELLRFAAGLVPWTLPFAVGLAVAGEPFARNVFGYDSDPSPWGLALLLGGGYAAVGRWAIVAAVLALAGWQARARRFDPYELTTLSMGAFLLLAPGFAVQYTVYLVPALLAVSRREGAAYALAAGAFIGSVYAQFLVSTWPLRSWHDAPLGFRSALLGVVVWVLLAGVIARRAQASRRRPRPA